MMRIGKIIRMGKQKVLKENLRILNMKRVIVMMKGYGRTVLRIWSRKMLKGLRRI